MSTGFQEAHESASMSQEFRRPVINDTYDDYILKYEN